MQSDRNLAPELSEALIPIWQKALGQPTITKSSNFFDFGADLAHLFELFDQISANFGRNLSPLLICQAPTVEALASLLEQPVLPCIAPMVLLKPGPTDQPPVFMAHGLGGCALDFFNLVKQVRWPRPVYCLQTRGLDGAEPPFERIEDAVEARIDLIRQVQPHGPYTLIGYSLGGLVMLETARRLAERGESIARLAMIDAFPHPYFMSPFLRGRLVARRMLSRALHRSGGLFSQHEAAPSASLRQFMDYMPRVTPYMASVRASGHVARMNYQPRRYAGVVHFIRSSHTPQFPPNPRAAWGKHLENMTIETIPGNHLELINGNAARLAQALTRCLTDGR